MSAASGSGAAAASAALHKLGLARPPRSPRPLRVMVLGQAGVGKSALVVRFLTRRFIGDYDPALERIYTHQEMVDGEPQAFEVLDWAGGLPGQEPAPSALEAQLRWADAFVLMYSVTDQCSFDECARLRFLISHARRRHRSRPKDSEAPVLLVGNKAEQPAAERMVAAEAGRRRARELGCAAFLEVSVRESPEQARAVFAELTRAWRSAGGAQRLQRSASDLPSFPVAAVATALGPFRARAGTDSQLQLSRKKAEQAPAHAPAPVVPAPAAPRRRMSMSMRGFPAVS